MTKYTAITFAPVQGFIEKSRKLIDLYGSSFLLSYLAYDLCKYAESLGHEIVSPGIQNYARGTPNNILIYGEFDRDTAETTFNTAWQTVTSECRYWIESKLKPDFYFCWDREWKQWSHHAWEFFWGTGDSMESARNELFASKLSRNWRAVNWQGDSSDLSGADAIAWHDMTPATSFKIRNFGAEKDEIKNFYERLSYEVGAAFLDRLKNFDTVQGERRNRLCEIFGEAIISPRERLSIPELVKRLVTLNTVSEVINNRIKQVRERQGNYELFESSFQLEPSASFRQKALANTPIEDIGKPFTEFDRFEVKTNTGWFLGDGDGVSNYLRNKSHDEIKKFSLDLMNWGKETLKDSVESNSGRLIYAGGDDFLGTFNPTATADICCQWLQNFSQVWERHGYREKGVTVSVGFVWTGHSVPQREVLQHCREAEKTAKKNGRDRLAIRIVFNNGNYLEWTIPWRFINLLGEYRDREGGKNWTHIYNDVAVLESRHAFRKEHIDIAKGILQIYFGEVNLYLITDENCLWNQDGTAGILGNRDNYAQPKPKLTPEEQINLAINNWIINLAKIGFHLFSNDSK
jgi:CRISPR-associated protein Cmr2